MSWVFHCFTCVHLAYNEGLPTNDLRLSAFTQYSGLRTTFLANMAAANKIPFLTHLHGKP